MSAPPQNPDASEPDPTFDDASRPSLAADGTLTRPVDPHASAAPVELEKDVVIELVERAPRPASVEPAAYRPVARRSRRLPWLAVGALAVAAVAVVLAFWKFPSLQRSLPALLPIGQRSTILFQTQPSGATLRIEGTVVGTTPFAADHLFGADARWSVTLAGHRAVTGRFNGDADQRVTLKLEAVKP